MGGGVQLGPLGTATTNRPIMPSPGDYDDGEIGGMMIGKGNLSTRITEPHCLAAGCFAGSTVPAFSRNVAILIRFLERRVEGC
jgi:hypothetical protein